MRLLTFDYLQSLEEIEMVDTSFTMCVESWPHNLMKSIFTMLILFSQYILPIIVLPGFYYNVRQDNCKYLLFMMKISFF